MYRVVPQTVRGICAVRFIIVFVGVHSGKIDIPDNYEMLSKFISSETFVFLSFAV